MLSIFSSISSRLKISLQSSSWNIFNRINLHTKKVEKNYYIGIWFEYLIGEKYIQVLVQLLYSQIISIFKFKPISLYKVGNILRSGTIIALYYLLDYAHTNQIHRQKNYQNFSSSSNYLSSINQQLFLLVTLSWPKQFLKHLLNFVSV